MTETTLIIAIPLTDGCVSPHFGHCTHVALIEVDQNQGQILNTKIIEAPPHEPGRFPALVAGHGAKLVIAGGMGGRALGLFAEQHIEVISGAPAVEPEPLVQAYLDGKLETSGNICDH